MTQLVIHHYAKPATRGKLGVGMQMAVVAIVFAGEQSAHWLGVHPMAAHGLAASLLAGQATGLGALPILFLRRPSEKLMAPMLGLAGGFAIMTTLGAAF